MNKLTQQQKDCINLILRSQDLGEGWRQCSPKIFEIIIQTLPEELLERKEQNQQVRLTTEGQTVSKWL